MAKIETQAFGKWILAGEHAVLRGSPAIVFPVFSRSMDLKFTPGSEALSAEFSGAHGSELQLLFWGVFERALEKLGLRRSEFNGRVELQSSIPIGGGMGASAALCVNVGKWLAQLGYLTERELYEFARQLENLFHGESSGVDIAVALSGQGLHFERAGKRELVEPKWTPRWYLSYSGKRGVTAECVGRVKALWETDPKAAEAIDLDMRRAVVDAEESLSVSESEGFDRLKNAISLAGSCFQRWGLASGEMGTHLKSLLDAGASAVKPTGSGDGGFALSLWSREPNPSLAGTLISLSPKIIL